MVESKALTFSENPLSGKSRFKLRKFNNYLLAIVIFIPFAFLSAYLFAPNFLFAWIADAVAIAVLLYFYRSFLKKRAIKICCPHCFKYIRSNTPWTCGFCREKNGRVDEFPFVNQCEHCGAEPKAYRCHYEECGKLIFLTEDHLESNYASRADAPVEDRTQHEITVQEQERRAKEHEITMLDLNAKLDERLTASRRQREFTKKKSPLESVKENFEKEFADVMAAEEFADEQEVFYEEKYKDNPDKLKRVKEWIADWRKRHI
jgi:hypothetical protein